eukprot:scaffold71486_cov30-Tisochrysis_lutea.AAC.6
MGVGHRSWVPPRGFCMLVCLTTTDGGWGRSQLEARGQQAQRGRKPRAHWGAEGLWVHYGARADGVPLSLPLPCPPQSRRPNCRIHPRR